MRSAFTMIELIFAIVIIAISIMSLPMMMRVNQSAVEANIVQEALFASTAKMMQVLSYPWDQHSIDNTYPGAYAKIVSVAGFVGATDNYPRIDANSSYRIGSIQEDNHRKFHNHSSLDANITATITSNGSTGLNDISQNNVLFINPAASATGYKNIYAMDVNVSYISDTGSPFVFASTGSATPSSMKLITINIDENQSGTMKTVVLLRAYSANIGEIDFAKRRY